MITTHFKRILIALDNSASSRHTLSYAKSFLTNSSPDIALVTVVPPAVPAHYGGDPLLGQQPVIVSEITEAQQQGANTFLDQIAVEFDGAGEVTKIQKLGSVRDGILDAADEWNADLIIMGTNGRTGLDHFFSGSVAEGLIRRSKAPVLVIPIPDELKDE